ncbi:protein kinase [Actinomadura nitritigenes]|uniref:protein kinase n=1 Tax=Actinomadura nitritigenes TaxID=134602 RepID=UPI003D94D442
MDALPGPGFAALIQPHTGDLHDFEATERGHSSDVTALATGEKGDWFVKAVRNRPGGRRDSLVREELINRHVQPISPPIAWRAENDEWLVLGFERVHGRHADFAPASSDLPDVVDVVRRIGALPLPEVAADWTETRWDRYATEPALLRGNTLLYTDINPDNILISNQAVWAVDWAWPTRGAAFIDPALLVVQLVAAGHAPEEADAAMAVCPAWENARAAAIDVFADANARMHETFAKRSPDTQWLEDMATAARRWADHRAQRRS